MNRDVCFYVSPIDGHCASSARNLPAPKGLFLLSTRGRRSDLPPLSSLAKGRRIRDSPPNPQSHINSTTPNAASKPTKANQPSPQQSKKHPPTTNQASQTNQTHNSKDENGDESPKYILRKNNLRQPTSQAKPQTNQTQSKKSNPQVRHPPPPNRSGSRINPSRNFG